MHVCRPHKSQLTHIDFVYNDIIVWHGRPSQEEEEGLVECGIIPTRPRQSESHCPHKYARVSHARLL